MPWKERLRYDPLPDLLDSDDLALQFFVNRNLLGVTGLRSDGLLFCPEVRALVKKQRSDGAWRYGGKRSIGCDYEYLETYRNLAILVDKYGLGRKHAAIADACEFLLTLQDQEGDIRGVYSNQYSPNYSGAIAALLIKAGYARDPRISRLFDWLISVRQNDGGWAIPFRTAGVRTLREAMSSDPIPPVRSMPSSQWATGIVLRAFAAHPIWRKSEVTYQAADLLKSRFFHADAYTDRKAKGYWTKFSYPFWYTDLVSSLDTLSRLGYPPDEHNIDKAMTWMSSRQRLDGSFDLETLRNGDRNASRWVAYAYCRSLCRFYGGRPA
jgi:hypothetical protein